MTLLVALFCALSFGAGFYTRSRLEDLKNWIKRN